MKGEQYNLNHALYAHCTGVCYLSANVQCYVCHNIIIKSVLIFASVFVYLPVACFFR